MNGETETFYIVNTVNTMEKITDVSVSKLESSRYIKPLRLHYSQNGIAKAWDLGMSAPSVAVVIYNKSRKTLVLVKQLRPAVLFAEIIKDFKATDDHEEKLNQLLKGEKFLYKFFRKQVELLYYCST